MLQLEIQHIHYKALQTSNNIQLTRFVGCDKIFDHKNFNIKKRCLDV